MIFCPNISFTITRHEIFSIAFRLLDQLRPLRIRSAPLSRRRHAAQQSARRRCVPLRSEYPLRRFSQTLPAAHEHAVPTNRSTRPATRHLSEVEKGTGLDKTTCLI